MKKSGRVLAIGGDLVDEIAPILEDTHYEMQRVPDGRTAVLITRNMTFSFLVASFPMPDMEIEEFLSDIRSVESASSTARLLVVTTDEHLPSVANLRDEGFVAGALSVDQPTERIAAQVANFMMTAPRIAVRVPVSIESDDDGVIEGQSVNISETGILVRCDRWLPPGSPVRITVSALRGSEAIVVEGLVVRHPDCEREHVLGMGMRFVEFEGDGRERLSVQIRNLLAEFVA